VGKGLGSLARASCQRVRPDLPSRRDKKKLWRGEQEEKEDEDEEEDEEEEGRAVGVCARPPAPPPSPPKVQLAKIQM